MLAAVTEPLAGYSAEVAHITSAQSAERGLLLILAMFRLGTLLQVDTGTAFGTKNVAAALPYIFTATLVNAFGFLVLAVCWSKQRARLKWLSAVDVIISVVVLWVQAHQLGPQWMVGSWVGWAPGLASCVSASLGIWAPSLMWVLIGSAALTVTYIAALLSIGVSHLPTIGINGFMYIVFASLLYILARYWRDLAARSDADRAAVVTAIKAAELDRYRLLVHDPATVLRMLGDPNTPEQLLPALRAQALSEASRMRAYLDGKRDPLTQDETQLTLENVTLSAMSSFSDLPIESSTLLARDVVLDEADALAIQRAITTLLHNVRLHSQAQHVIVHADAFDSQWELIVSDDGVGFLPEHSDLGYGLGEQVVEAMRRIGAHVDISSAPGEGTRVVMTGPYATTLNPDEHQEPPALRGA